jgi:hypothetical protein
MSQTTATVEVLTAEVRVLMVGSRQVTLSVFNQLDETFYWSQFVPFGRVRPKERGLWLVGQDTETGALVKYQPERPTHACWIGAAGELRTWGEARSCQHDYCNTEIEREWAWYKGLEEMPLIVLAGLR